MNVTPVCVRDIELLALNIRLCRESVCLLIASRSQAVFGFRSSVLYMFQSSVFQCKFCVVIPRVNPQFLVRTNHPRFPLVLAQQAPLLSDEILGSLSFKWTVCAADLCREMSVMPE